MGRRGGDVERQGDTLWLEEVAAVVERAEVTPHSLWWVKTLEGYFGSKWSQSQARLQRPVFQLLDDESP